MPTILEDYFDFRNRRKCGSKATASGCITCLKNTFRESRRTTLRAVPNALKTKILACLLYYHENKRDMDTYLANLRGWSRRRREESLRKHGDWLGRLRQKVCHGCGTPQGIGMIRGVLLDEHYPHWWAGAISVSPAGLPYGRSVGPTPRHPEPRCVMLVWLEANQFIFVTNNRRSMPGHLAKHIAANRHVEGIFVVHPSFDIRVLASELELIVGASLPNEFRDQILELPVT